MTVDTSWRDALDHMRRVALSLSVLEFEYRQLDIVLGKVIVGFREDYKTLLVKQPGDVHTDIALRFERSLDMLQETFALLVADRREGTTYELFLENLEAYKIEWLRQLPR